MTQRKFTQEPQSTLATKGGWASRQRPFRMEDIRRRHCKLGELRRLATVVRPDFGARLARLASEVSSLKGSDIYDLIKTVGEWQQANVFNYQFGRHLGASATAGWPDAASGYQSEEGRCRLGYRMGILPSALRSPYDISQWSSKFTRKAVWSSPCGEVYAFSGAAGHVELSCGFLSPFADGSPGMLGCVDCEGLFNPFRQRNMGSGEYLMRPCASIQAAVQSVLRIGCWALRIRRMASTRRNKIWYPWGPWFGVVLPPGNLCPLRKVATRETPRGVRGRCGR